MTYGLRPTRKCAGLLIAVILMTTTGTALAQEKGTSKKKPLLSSMEVNPGLSPNPKPKSAKKALAQAEPAVEWVQHESIEDLAKY